MGYNRRTLELNARTFQINLEPSGELRLDASPEMGILGIGGLGGMLGSTACDALCRECSMAGVMQDFAARLQRPFELRLFFSCRELALLRDLPKLPDQQNVGNVRSWDRSALHEDLPVRYISVKDSAGAKCSGLN